MDSISNDLVNVLQYLLPGFLTAWVFYSLTSYPKPSQFERVIQAFIFTLIIQVGVSLEKSIFVSIGSTWNMGYYTDQTKLFCSVVNAFLLGIVFSYFANNDRFHKLLRELGITRETSFPSEWFGTFLNNVTYVVLHLKDERRVYGWPVEWPSQPDDGHFQLIQASWIENGEDKPITGVESILINVNDVKWIEFMTKTWETQNGKEKLKPTTTIKSVGNTKEHQ